MDWIDRIELIKFSIKTGDGKVYFPKYRGGETEREYNTSSFEFINVYGTLVDRKKPKSRKIPLVFYFDGADNIDKSNEFEYSADDPRPWTVVHPFYGTINGQPISIKRDDSNLNITEITVPFWESIDADYPVANFTVKDNTRDRHNVIYFAAANSYVTNNKITSADIPKNSSSLADMAGEFKNLQDDTTYATFQNALNTGLKAIDRLLDDPLAAIQSIQNFLDLPSVYERAIEGRFASYENIYWRFKDSIKTLVDKKYFESIGASTIASMSVTAVNPQQGDYNLVSDVENITYRLSVIYTDYVQTLDDLKVSVYDVNNTYNADAEVQTELNSLVNYTIANLYQMSFQAKRERIIITGKKTNPILMVHRLIGMDENDDNLDDFIQANNIKLLELFSIGKGRELRYAK
ncbi:hypothetical protein [Flavobacterium phage FL-1]|nr:hypothetical protein [Flavobacterium phage FL-1]